jgi:hypothetical protein
VNDRVEVDALRAMVKTLKEATETLTAQRNELRKENMYLDRQLKTERGRLHRVVVPAAPQDTVN